MDEFSQEPEANSEARRWRIPAIFWLVLLCLLMVGVAIGLMVWVPKLQQRRAVEAVQRLGGVVLQESVESRGGGDLASRLFGERRDCVVAVDLSSADLTDESLDLLKSFDELRRLSISGAGLTDDGVRRLQELRNLEVLVLVDCPNVSEAVERDLRREIPGLRISRRGSAVLGVSGNDGQRGVIITSVVSGSSAHRGGILPGSVVTKINGRGVKEFELLAREIARYQPGDEITVTVLMRGERKDLRVKLDAWRSR